MLTGWDPDVLVEETDRHKISCVLMVPVQLRELLSDGEVAEPGGLFGFSCAIAGSDLEPRDRTTYCRPST